MDPKKLKIQWIVNRKRRQAALRKRRATLIEKASELATLCDIAVAVVVYGYGEAVPTTWPSATETRRILQRYMNLPDISKRDMNIEAFLRERIDKVTRRLNNLKIGNRNLTVDCILNDISLGRRHNLDDLTPELAAAVKSSYVARMKLADRYIKFPIFHAAATPLPAGDEIMPTLQQEPLAMVPVVSDVPAPVVAPPPLAMVPVVSQVPSAPLATAPVVADAPVSVLPMELDGVSSHGSFLMEMVKAIMDDGSGSEVVPTAADVERILKGYGPFKPQ